MNQCLWTNQLSEWFDDSIIINCFVPDSFINSFVTLNEIKCVFLQICWVNDSMTSFINYNFLIKSLAWMNQWFTCRTSHLSPLHYWRYNVNSLKSLKNPTFNVVIRKPYCNSISGGVYRTSPVILLLQTHINLHTLLSAFWSWFKMIMIN